MDEEKYFIDNRFINISSSGNNNDNLLETSVQIYILMVGGLYPCELDRSLLFRLKPDQTIIVNYRIARCKCYGMWYTIGTF